MRRKTIKLAGCLLKSKDDDCLLIRRNFGNIKQWELPGGKIENKESSKTAAERELKEEINVNVKAGELITVNRFTENQIDYTYYIYSGEIVEGAVEIVEKSKFDKFAYFSKEQLKNSLNHLSINMRLFIESIKEIEA